MRGLRQNDIWVSGPFPGGLEMASNLIACDRDKRYLLTPSIND
jgi:hypothetical protein